MRRIWPDPTDDIDVLALVAADDRPPPPDRPWVLVNMISSLDGAVTVDGRSRGLARPADKAMFDALRAIADVVLVGAGTMRVEGYRTPRPLSEAQAARAERGQLPAPRLAVVTAAADLDLAAPPFAEATTPPLVITAGSAPAERRAALAEVCDVVVSGTTHVDLTGALRRLREEGVVTVTCEGGPTLNRALLAEDLVDEWALTMAPVLVGAGALRSMRGAPSDHPPRELRLDRLVEGDGLLLGRWVRATAPPGPAPGEPTR